MGLMAYSAIYNAVAAQGPARMFVPPNCKLSLPIPYQRGGRQFDALFFYPAPEENRSGRPLGWMLLDSETGRLAFLADCSVNDFLPSGLCPPESVVELEKSGHSQRREQQLAQKLGDLYEEMRTFVFTENLGRAQAAVAAAYKELFLKLCPAAHYPFYYALSPGFFHWLRLPLPDCRAEQPVAEDAREDTTQLLILENLKRLLVRFESKIQTDAHKQAVFDEVHRELQEYKNGLLDSLTSGLERDIIKLIDDTQKTLAVFSEKPATPESYERLFALYSGVATDLEDLLYRHGVEPYFCPPGAVNLSRQKILSTVETGDPALDKTVAQVVSRGWEKQGRIIRPERVTVYLCEAATNHEEENR